MLSNLSAFDLLTDAYLVLNEERVIIAANEQYCELTCQSREQILGRCVFEINLHGSAIAQAQRRHILEALFERLKVVPTVESPPLRYPLPMAHADLAERYWTVFASRREVSDDSGVSQTVYIFRLQDVTKLHLEDLAQRKEKALLRSTAQLRQRLVADARVKSEQDNNALKEALAFAHIGAWTLDLQTGVIDCTAQCKANYGMPDDYFMTHDNLLNDLINVEDRERVQGVISHSLQCRESFEVEYRTTWPTGEVRWVMVRGKFPEGDDGTATRISGFSLDITERKAVELETAARMEIEVDARRTSENRVKSIDTFVSAVSHELRSPLNAIGSWAQLLGHPDQITLPKAAEVIQRNVRQLSLLIEDLLDTGAVINDKFHVTLETIDMADIVISVAEDARLNIESKGLAFKTELIESCPIQGDETRLRQVIFNLLTNAAKFTESGEIVVALCLSGKVARFSVRDTGVGISRDKKTKIFERFSQVTEIGATRGGGLGLGLWIANTIVMAHHGALLVESEGMGHGSTFIVELPISRS